MRLSERQVRVIDVLNAAHDAGHRWLGAPYLSGALSTGVQGVHRTMASLVRRGLAVRSMVDGRVTYRLADKLRKAAS